MTEIASASEAPRNRSRNASRVAASQTRRCPVTPLLPLSSTASRQTGRRKLVGGLLGFRPDDERLREALQIAEREGLDYKFEKVTIADAAHPNTVRINVELDGTKSTMLGSSLGAGRILVQEIDGYPVEVTGNLHTIVLVAEDRKGSIARITGILAEHDVNIATLRLSRQERGGDAFMVIECDDVPDKKAGEELRALDWVRWTRRLPKVSGG